MPTSPSTSSRKAAARPPATTRTSPTSTAPAGWCKQAIDEFGRLDILVNNAGIVRDSTIVKMSEADFDAVFNVHVKGTWAPAKHAAIYWTDKFKETGVPVGGRIINTTSGAGLTGNFGQTNYASAKAAINVDDPDPQPRAVQGRRDGQLRRPRRRHPNHRHDARRAGVIEADDVPLDEWNRMDPAVSSPLVAWLASDEADHVTGQVIRAVAENIILMKPWSDGPTINNGQKRWDATKLGTQLATDVFFTRARASATRRSVTFSHAELPGEPDGHATGTVTNGDVIAGTLGELGCGGSTAIHSATSVVDPGDPDLTFLLADTDGRLGSGTGCRLRGRPDPAPVLPSPGGRHG